MRVASVTALALIVGGVAACANDFDTSRPIPSRGTLGEELYGVMCDRVAAQSLREDLTGASFKGVCHKRADGTYADKVDTSLLPALKDNALDTSGKPATLDKQNADRAHAIARIETLGKRRAELITAFDFAMPDIKIAIKDLKNPDAAQSCNAPAAGGEGALHDELANMLGRFVDLYNDGTIPQSTEALGRLLDAFKKSPDATAALARFDAREGYRPLKVALGATRPIVAYPRLRDLSNATLRLLSADSDPYGASKTPVPGAAYAQFSKLLAVAHEELRTYTPDAAPAALPPPATDMAGRLVLARPRTNLEFIAELMYSQDPAFGGGAPRFIVKRDSRGVADVRLAGGAVPAPFVDKDGDRLADLDDLGQFITVDGNPVPSPFYAVGAPDGQRDPNEFALGASATPLFNYIDTSHTYSAQLLSDLAPLVNPDPNQKHETLMNALAGAYALFGSRDGMNAATRAYAPDPSLVDQWSLTHSEPPPSDLATRPVSLQYNSFHADESPLVDLVYAFGQTFADQSTDDTLALTKQLMTDHQDQVARLAGDALSIKVDVADRHPEASLPKTSTLWDEVLDNLAKTAQEPGLLEDVLRALSNDSTLELVNAFSGFEKYKDRITYDRTNLNGKAWNATTNSTSEMQTPVDRSQPDTGDNRSGFQRFIQVIHDTNGVTACNKEGTVVHASGLPIIGTLDIPSGVPFIGRDSYHECELFKIDNLAKFYLDSIIGKASMYYRVDLVRNGFDVFGAHIGAATVGLIEDSSGLTGFWAGDWPQLSNADRGSQTFRPQPRWLNRLVFFDLAGDSPNSGDPNYKTNHFLADSQGAHTGTAACPERVIPDPCFSDNGTCSAAPDASKDGMVHGLRDCAEGDWLFQRDRDATFVWENFNFYKGIGPLVDAYASHGREDLFLDMMEVLHKHWQDDKGTASECKLATVNGQVVNCTKDGAVSYEAILGDAFAGDILPALHDLSKTLQAMRVPHCTAADPTTHACTATTMVDGVSVLAEATRALVDPARAQAAGVKDRKGNVTATRNDGTTNPQVTPLYLMLQALNGIDDSFASYAQKNPNDKTPRQDQWKSARSQLVDQFLDVRGRGTPNASFKNASLPKFGPILIDVLRSQLIANCPGSFQPPYARCDWARDTLAQKLANVVGGPSFAAALDLTDAIRADDAARVELEALLAYLLDAASDNEALSAMLASAADLIQVLRDDTNLTPVFHVLAQGAQASLVDQNGQIVQKSLVDAELALHSRISGRAYDANNNELCSRELDPNQVLSVVLAKLVTPMPDAQTGKDGRTPLEVIADVVADVNRASPAPDSSTKLTGEDFASIADNVSDFLMNKESGLEQFYAIVRNGTVR